MVWSPPGTRETTRHCSRALQPRSSGTPSEPISTSMPANFSCDDFANRFDNSIWSSARMLTAKRSALKNAGCEWLLTAWLQRTSGGSSDTELNELAVTPWNPPSSSVVVTTVTPVTKLPSTRRRLRLSNRRSSGIFHLLALICLWRSSDDSFFCLHGRHHVLGEATDRGRDVGVRHGSKHEASDHVVHPTSRDLVGEHLRNCFGRTGNGMAGFGELIE